MVAMSCTAATDGQTVLLFSSLNDLFWPSWYQSTQNLSMLEQDGSVVPSTSYTILHIVSLAYTLEYSLYSATVLAVKIIFTYVNDARSWFLFVQLSLGTLMCDKLPCDSDILLQTHHK